jgi:predicted O-linked N-acetylglucosamine transferase (SPINDLY family)
LQLQKPSLSHRAERLRVAYLSADFHEHATAYLMAELFERHDRQRFEWFGLSYGPPDSSPMRKRLEAAFGRFIDISRQPTERIAELVRDLGVDIAVDLKGYTGDYRLDIFAYRAAPIQVSYLGYPGTTGTNYIDYIIADRHVIPPERREFFTEQVVYLPDSYQVNDSKRPLANLALQRSDVGLPEHGFVFCSFNYPYKITPEMFDVWMRLLRKVEGSVLWLYADVELALKNLLKEAVARGVSPDRIVCAQFVKHDDHLARLRLADLFLDTLPVNAHTTASDALAAGLPLVTCAGESFAARVAASLLHAIGLPELATHSLEEYEALVLDLATDAGRLADIRSRLARNRETHPLFDTDRFRRHIESAYLMMWERHQRGLAPEGFAVDPAQQ